MRLLPLPADGAGSPVAGGLVLLSVGVTIAAFLGEGVGRWSLDARAFHGEPWRSVTSILVHVGPVHLIFDVLWIWVLGRAIERCIGSLRLALVSLYLGLVAGLAEFALFDGAVGLSGIVYGYLALAVFLGRKDRRLGELVDGRLLVFFAIWFVCCVLATRWGLAKVANVAHAAGTVAGAAIGVALSEGRRGNVVGRYLALFVAIALLGFTVAGATIGRPFVNRSADAAEQAAQLGRAARDAGRHDMAIGLFEDAVELEPEDAERWIDLGLALQVAGRREGAQDAYEQAARIRAGNAP